MANRNERMEKLAQAGINTGKYFNISLPEGLAPGATISVVINENGQPVIVNNAIENQIIEDGYVRNTRLHRRFVMAQMMHMLNYVSYKGNESGFHACLRNRYAYHYTFEMMLEEVRVLSKLEQRDKESFEERSHFFTLDVVAAVVDDYMNKLKAYVDKLPVKKCKGIPYKRVKSVNIFVDDLEKKLYKPLVNKAHKIVYACNYSEACKALNSFMRSMVKLPYDTPKSKVWIDAFKGEGAYYTLKNLVMFHDCEICESEPRVFGDYIFARYKGDLAVKYLDTKLDEYYGEGWRMFALMKKVIDDNGFDFNAKMREIYSEK